jgi:hypothetical protein
MLNKAWHEKHVMPKNATLEQRVKWHEAHSKHCGCREMPASIAKLIAERGKPKPAASGVKKFSAVMQDAGSGGVYIEVPFDVEKVYGTRGRVPIKAIIDGQQYRGSLVRMSSACHLLLILKAIREQIGKDVGDKVKIELTRDTEARTVEIPADFQKLLNKHKDAKAIFDELAYSHRREYVQWIESAKRAGTRAARIEKAITMLCEGKREPR